MVTDGEGRGGGGGGGGGWGWGGGGWFVVGFVLGGFFDVLFGVFCFVCCWVFFVFLFFCFLFFCIFFFFLFFLVVWLEGLHTCIRESMLFYNMLFS